MRFVVIGGGGKVALQFAKAASSDNHQVVSVVRNQDHFEEIKKAGAQPRVLSLEDASVNELVDLFQSEKPDCVVFSAGAGGKGGEDRTKAVDYEGAIKVFDGLEAANIHRFIMVSAADLRDTNKPPPDYYNEESKRISERMWKAIPAYMKWKRAADLELYKRKALRFTIIRPGGLTDEPAQKVELGKPQLGRVSRETVAKVILEAATAKGAEGAVWDLMDGSDDIPGAVKKAIESGISSWHD